LQAVLPECDCRSYAQHLPWDWTGGQATVPYEQKTQQSPCFGLSLTPHPRQSWKYWQALVGMTSAD